DPSRLSAAFAPVVLAIALLSLRAERECVFQIRFGLDLPLRRQPEIQAQISRASASCTRRALAHRWFVGRGVCKRVFFPRRDVERTPHWFTSPIQSARSGAFAARREGLRRFSSRPCRPTRTSQSAKDSRSRADFS